MVLKLAAQPARPSVSGRGGVDHVGTFFFKGRLTSRSRSCSITGGFSKTRCKALLERASLKKSPNSQKEATLTSSSSGSVPSVEPGCVMRVGRDPACPDSEGLVAPAGWVGNTALHSSGEVACVNDNFRPCRLRCSLERSLTI